MSYIGGSLALDVTDTDQIPGALDAAARRFGGTDVLVNNAGRGLLGALEGTIDAAGEPGNGSSTSQRLGRKTSCWELKTR